MLVGGRGNGIPQAGRRALTLRSFCCPIGNVLWVGRGVTSCLSQGGAGSWFPVAQVMEISSRAPPMGLSSGRRLPSN